MAQIFSERHPPFCRFYFTLGRGKPKQPIERMWFTYQGRILGSLEVDAVIVNDGTLPRLSRLDGGESEWQIKKDAWVAICSPPCQRLKERLFHEPFRGWRYFNIDQWRENPASRHRF